MAVTLLAAASGHAAALSPETLERYEAMLLRNPAPGIAFNHIYKHYSSEGEIDALHARWSRAAEAQPATAVQYQLLLGYLAERNDESAQARIHFRQATDAAPDNAQAWMALGALELAENHLKQAALAYEKATALPMPPADAFPVFTDLARIYQRMVDIDAELRTWQRLNNAFPGDPLVITETARALSAANRHAEGINLLEQLQKAPDSTSEQRVKAMMLRAELQADSGDFEAACTTYKTAEGMVEPGSWHYREISARMENLFRKHNDLAGLAEFYLVNLRAGTRSVENVMRLVPVLIDLKRYDEAAQWMHEALTWAPGRTDIAVTLAELQLATGNYENARSIIADIIKRDPENLAYHQLMGECWWREFETTGNARFRKKAIQEWSRLVPADSRDTVDINNYGDLLRAHGLQHEALVQYYRALDIAPDRFDQRERLVIYLLSLDREERAWQLIDELDATAMPVASIKRMAELLARYGKAGQALSALDVALQKEPGQFSLDLLKWRILVQAEHWAAAEKAYPRLMEMAENDFYREDLQQRYLDMIKNMPGWPQRLDRWKAEAHSNPEELELRDIRLLLHVLIDMRIRAETEGILEYALRQYPEDYLLLSTEAKFWKTFGSADRQVRAWRKLMDIRPERRAEWLREIVIAYRSEKRYAEALKVANDMREEFPSDAIVHNLYAETCYEAGRHEEGNNALRRALALTVNPQDLRLRLARALLEQGRPDEAYSAYLDALVEADGMDSRLALLGPLTDLSIKQWKLQQLLDSLRTEPGLGEDWERSLYASKVHMSIDDWASARPHMENVIASQGRAPQFVRDRLAIARHMKDTDAELRYMRMLARAGPDPLNQLQLANILVRTGDSEEAIRILRNHAVEILSNNTTLEDMHKAFLAAGLQDRFSEVLLESARARAPDWKTSYSLAEHFIQYGSIDAAESLLWEVLSVEAEIIPSHSLSNRSAALRTTHEDTRHWWEGVYISKQARKRFESLALGPYLKLHFTRQAFPSQSNIQEAQISSIVYLAGIATLNDKPAAFIEKLRTLLDEKGSSPEGRLMAFIYASAMEEVLDEIEQIAESANFSRDAFLFCHEALVFLMSSPPDFRIDVPRIIPLAETLEARIIQSDPGSASAICIKQAERLAKHGARPQAAAVLLRNTGIILEAGPARISEAISVCSGILEQQDAKAFLHRLLSFSLRENRPLADSHWTVLFGNYMKSLPRREALQAAERDAIKNFLLLKSLNPDKNVRTLAPRRFNTVPGPDECFDPLALYAFSKGVNSTRDTAISREWKPILRELMAEHPEMSDRFTQMLGYIEWWTGDRHESARTIEQLANARGSQSLTLSAARMHSQLNDHEKALELLQGMRPSHGTLDALRLAYTILEMRTLGRTDELKAFIRGINTSGLAGIPGFNLNAEIKNLGMETDKGITAPRIKAQSVQQLRQEVNTLAKSETNEQIRDRLFDLLGASPTFSSGNRRLSLREEALLQLARIGEIEHYIANVKKLLNASPGSITLSSRLAEALYAEGKRTKDNSLIDEAIERLEPVIAHGQGGAHARDLYIQSLKTANRHDDLADYYLDRLNTDRDDSLAAVSTMTDAFVRTNRMDELINVLNHIPRLTGKMALMQVPEANVTAMWQSLASAIGGSGSTHAAIALIDKALARAPVENTYTLRLQWMTALKEDAPRERVLQLLSDYYFPEVSDTIDPLWLRTSSHSRFDAWIGRINIRNTYSGYARLEMLRHVKDPSIIHELTASARADLGSLTPLERVYRHIFLLCAGVVLEADWAGEDLEPLVAAMHDLDPRLGNYYIPKLYTNFLPAIIDDHIHATTENRLNPESMLRATETATAYLPASANIHNKLRRQTATVAQSKADYRIMRKSVNALMGQWQDVMGTDNRPALEEALWILEKAIAAQMGDEARQWLAFIKAYPSLDLETNARLESFAARIHCISGGQDNYKPVIWVEREQPAQDEIQIAWEIVTDYHAHPGHVSVFANDADSLSGKYDLRIYTVDAQQQMQLLATRDKANNRGHMQLPLHEPASLIAVITDPANPDFNSQSEILHVSAGRNLLANPDFSAERAQDLVNNKLQGWSNSNSFLVRVHGGPGSDGLCIQGGHSMRKETEVIADVFTIEPGQDYLFSCWISAPGLSRIRAGVRFLDERGTLLDTVFASGFHQQFDWKRISMRFSNQEHPGTHPIPPGSRQASVVLVMEKNAAIDSLYFGKIPREPDENTIE